MEHDATDLALPRVTVGARRADGGKARTGVTGGTGRFTIAGLPPGPDDVTFTLPGPARRATLTDCEKRSGCVVPRQ